MRIVILGLSITSSWGNGHANIYRGLVRELSASGHKILFLERDMPWFAQNRDLPEPPHCRTYLYSSIPELKKKFTQDITDAECVIVGSCVPEGATVGDLVMSRARGVTAFYDMDTPFTLSYVKENRCSYLTRKQARSYHIYLSSTSGPTLERIEREFGSPMARALLLSADPENYYPESGKATWDLGYLGTYSHDRQRDLEELMLKAAGALKTRSFVVAGPRYPDEIIWPFNVQRIEHLPPNQHRKFYNQQRFTLNITRSDMKKAGYCPSARLFEAAACGTPIISDLWEGLSDILEPGREVLVSRSAEETMEYLLHLPEKDRVKMGIRARDRVLRSHTAVHRAAELEKYIRQAATSGEYEKAG
jgi:spore maturation protein CgeB